MSRAASSARASTCSPGSASISTSRESLSMISTRAGEAGRMLRHHGILLDHPEHVGELRLELAQPRIIGHDDENRRDMEHARGLEHGRGDEAGYREMRTDLVASDGLNDGALECGGNVTASLSTLRNTYSVPSGVTNRRDFVWLPPLSLSGRSPPPKVARSRTGTRRGVAHRSRYPLPSSVRCRPPAWYFAPGTISMLSPAESGTAVSRVETTATSWARPGDGRSASSSARAMIPRRRGSRRLSWPVSASDREQ